MNVQTDNQLEPSNRNNQDAKEKFWSDYGIRPFSVVFWGLFGICIILSFALIAAVPQASKVSAEDVRIGAPDSNILNSDGSITRKTFSFQPSKNSLAKAVFFTGLTKQNLAFVIRGYVKAKDGLSTQVISDIKARVRLWGYNRFSDLFGLVNTPPDVDGNFTTKWPSLAGKTQAILDLLLVRAVRYNNYYIRIDFDQNVDLSTQFQSLQLQAEYTNGELTQYMLVSRYIFFAFSLLTTIAYAVHCYRRSELSYEQSLTLILAGTVTCFNDPFFGIYIRNPNAASSFFSVLFISIFAISMIAYWMKMLEYIAADRVEPEFSWPRCAIYLCLVVSLFGSHLAFQLLNSRLPFLNLFKANTAVRVMYVFNLLTIVGVTCYLLFYSVRIFRKETPLLRRQKIFLVLSLPMYVISMVAIISLALNFYRFGNWSITVLFWGNLIVWVYEYMFTATDDVNSSQPQENPPASEHDNDAYLDFQSNKDERD